MQVVLRAYVDSATYPLPRSEAQQSHKTMYQSSKGPVNNHMVQAATTYDKIATQKVEERRNDGKGMSVVSCRNANGNEE